MSVALDSVLAELELRRRVTLSEELPRWDWYGPDCGCPPEGRRPNGACPAHKRARLSQRPPGGPWSLWYYEGGRGTGKTEAGAQWLRSKAAEKGSDGRFALVAPTAADARDVMVEGPSGIMRVSPPWERPLYEPSKRRLTWPNGAIGILYSADEPERLRGPQHTDAWCDEPAAWRDPAAFDMLMFGMRLGTNPQCIMTTTPKPRDWLRAIKKRLGTVITRGSTYENRDNLAESFFTTIIRKYEGTRLGRQELEAEDLEDTPGALWNTTLLDSIRVAARDLPDRIRVVVAVDPSVADPETSPDESTAECGIIVGMVGHVQHPTLGLVPFGYLLADRSMRGHPNAWGKAVVNAYHEFEADLVVAEANNGGAMVASNIQATDSSVPVKLLHASRGKITRAEPVANLYEQHRIWHVDDQDFSLVESQMCNWVPGLKSPDRMDALVWAFTELMIESACLEIAASPWTGWRGS